MAERKAAKAKKHEIIEVKETAIWNSQTQLQEIKQIYGKDLTDNEFKIFIGIGKATGLNPFLREIWAVKYNNNPASIFVGRDGYRKSAQKDPEYDYHLSDAVYANDQFKVENGEVKHTYNVADRGALVGGYAIVKRKSAEKPMFCYVSLKEYGTGKSLWASKPATMIKKVAEAQALRMAFQGLFAGTYDESEAWDEEKPARRVAAKAETAKAEIIDVPKEQPIKNGTLVQIRNMVEVQKVDAEKLKSGLVKVTGKETLETLTEDEGQKILAMFQKKLEGEMKTAKADVDAAMPPIANDTIQKRAMECKTQEEASQIAADMKTLELSEIKRTALTNILKTKGFTV